MLGDEDEHAFVLAMKPTLRSDVAMNAIHDRDALLLPESLAGLDLNLVVAFDALVREGNVTRAASRLGVTQSAMSHALRRLRELLDDPVLVRIGNTMVLTPRAQELVVPLRTGLLALARALRQPLQFDPTTAQRAFTLATPDLFDVLVLPGLLERVRVEAQGIDLKLIGMRGRALSERLETGEIDVAIVPRFDAAGSGPVAPETPGLIRRSLFRDRFACFMRRDHPALRGNSKKLGLSTYLSLSHALVSPGGDGLGPVDDVLRARKLQRRVMLTVPYFTSALAIVSKSDLVLTAPAALAGLGLREFGLVALRPPLPLPEHSVNIVWHERYTNDAGQRWLRELLADVAQAAQAEVAKLTDIAIKPRSR